MTKITIELNNDLAQKVEQLVDFYGESKNALFENFIKNHQDKIRLKIEKVDKDLNNYEEKYAMSSENFYTKFEKGEVEDSHDFMIWAGIYEIKLNSENELKRIS